MASQQKSLICLPDKSGYIYQTVDFTVKAAEGYCFAEDFAILVNGEKLDPTSFEDGVYSYSFTLTEEELSIAAVAVVFIKKKR